MVERTNLFEGDLVVRRPGVTDRTARAVVSADGLFLDDVRIAGRDAVIGCATESIRDDGTCRLLLVFETSRVSSCTFVMPDAESARSFVSALGVDAEQRALSVTFTQKWGMREELLPWVIFFALVGLWLAILNFIPAPSAVCFLVALAGIAFIARLGVMSTTITVGSDGIYRERFGRRRFVAFAEIARVVRKDGGLFLELRDGGAVRLIRGRTTPEEGRAHALDDYVELLGLRILDAIEASRSRGRAAGNDQLLERGERSPRQWIEELRESEKRSANYRSLPPVEENLPKLVADGSRDAAIRVGAAIALRAREGEAVVPHLRVAAAATASPKLRVALEKIAEGAPDEEIARRIEKLR